MRFPVRYPLTLSFKIVALAPQFSVQDAEGHAVAYVRQKLFKLREAVTVFEDERQGTVLFTIQADRVLDISARYHFSDPIGTDLGSVKRRGLKSLWRAHFDILEGEGVVMTLQEENPWVKVLDTLIGQIPFVSLFSGYFCHPSYLVARPDGTGVMRMVKRPAFFEGKFEIEKLAPLSEADEKRALLSYLMMLLLERARG